MLYIFKSAITLALLYSCFFFLLSKETFHRFNRIMLICIMAVSLIMPLFHFTTEHPTIINEELYEVQNTIQTDTVDFFVTQNTKTMPRLTWIQLFMSVYIIGVIMMLIINIIQVLSLILLMHGGLRHTDSQGNTVILLKGNITPFSIFHYIVMNVSDYEQHRDYILTHEQEHIRLRHTYDLLILEAMKVFQWFNPFIWFISRDLKTIHEYEADQAVINHGIDAKEYQQLLVIKVVGNRLQPFTNNLNHGSLKKRITMMYKRPSNRWLMLKALCAIPVLALTLNAFATPNHTDPVEDIVNTLENKEVAIFNTKTQTSIITQKVIEKVEEERTETYSDRVGQNEDNDQKYPIVVIDGKIVTVPSYYNHKGPIEDEDIEKFFNLKKEDIAHIEVLHEASATAMYGEKGKNGAILITSKQKAEDARIDSLVERLPDAQRNDDGSITINGKRVKKINLEGKEVYNDDNEIWEICEEMPQYPGGQEALMKLFAENVRYPKIATENGIQGVVIVQFIIRKDGTCTDFKIKSNSAHNMGGITVTANAKEVQKNIQKGEESSQSPEEILAMGKSLEDEVIRVCQLMKKWTPGRQRGNTVNVKYNIPVTFRLQ